MEYRILPHGGEKISVIGLGSGSLAGTEQEMTQVIRSCQSMQTPVSGAVIAKAAIPSM